MSISTAFTSSDLLFLIPGLTLLVLSLFFFVLGKEKSALVLLVAGAFSLRLLMIVTEPFINLWDEQFHALVARNMMNHLLHPVLYNTPVLPYDYRDWGANYTWLHKPPLFMWQMALSMKVFGIHPFAVRLPSAILSALCVPALYRIGFLLAGRRIGYLAALLLACSFIQLHMVAGILNTDHSDLVFMAYITFSIWSWTEYMHSGKKRWLLLTGLFSGMAILVKWLVGLLVYAGWGLALLANKDLRRNIRRWLDIGLALVCTTCVALPWHIYSRLHWPLEWAEETAENAAHLTHDMGHPGAWWYHFGVYVQHNGYLLVVLLIPGLFLFARSAAKAHFKYSFLGMIALVYVFFSFVQARMPLFCLIVSPLLMLAAAYSVNALYVFVKEHSSRFSSLALSILLLSISLPVLNLNKLERLHTDLDSDTYRSYRMTSLHNTQRALVLLQGKPYVVFNCGPCNAVMFMFYSGLTAYDKAPLAKEVDSLLAKQYQVAVFDNGQLLPELKNDPRVLILPFSLQ